VDQAWMIRHEPLFCGRHARTGRRIIVGLARLRIAPIAGASMSSVSLSYRAAVTAGGVVDTLFFMRAPQRHHIGYPVATVERNTHLIALLRPLGVRSRSTAGQQEKDLRAHSGDWAQKAACQGGTHALGAKNWGSGRAPARRESPTQNSRNVFRARGSVHPSHRGPPCPRMICSATRCTIRNSAVPGTLILLRGQRRTGVNLSNYTVR